jgi:hypothetical protein
VVFRRRDHGVEGEQHGEKSGSRRCPHP